VRRFFDSVAVGWDERVRSDSPEYLEPLVAALDRLEASPGCILDIGTGTGAAALEEADRYSDAEVVGIDIFAKMVAKAKAADRSGPVPGRRPRELRRRGRVRPDRDAQHAAVLRPGYRPPEARRYACIWLRAIRDKVYGTPFREPSEAFMNNPG
jgi:SAM-dependent methyltransferase